MKKGLLLVVVMLATIAVKAQDIYVGGSLNVWRNSTGNTTSFKVAPEVGYNLMRHGHWVLNWIIHIIIMED